MGEKFFLENRSSERAMSSDNEEGWRLYNFSDLRSSEEEMRGIRSDIMILPGVLKEFSDHMLALDDLDIVAEKISIIKDVCNISGVVRALSDQERDEAMASIHEIWEMTKYLPPGLDGEDLNILVRGYLGVVLFGDNVPFGPWSQACMEETRDMSPSDVAVEQVYEYRRYWTALGHTENMVQELIREWQCSDIRKGREELQYTPFNPAVELWKVRHANDISFIASLDGDEFGSVYQSESAREKHDIQGAVYTSSDPHEVYSTKKERYTWYKEMVLHQKEGIAIVQDELIQSVLQYPDTYKTEDSLMEIVFQYAQTYQFSDQQIVAFSEGIQASLEKRKKIYEAVNDFPSPSALYEACFGVRPLGDVHVKRAPMMLYFQCEEVEDYTWILHGNYGYVRGRVKGTEGWKKTQKRVQKSGGCAVFGSLYEGVEGCLAAENNNISHGTDFEMRTFIHEQQHVTHRLFQEPLMRVDFQWLNKNGDVHEACKIIKESLRSKREEFLGRAKDEVLAYYTEGESTDRIRALLLKEDGLYNYYKTWIDRSGDYLRKGFIQKILDDSGEISDAMQDNVRSQVDAAFQSVMVEEYEDIVQRALDVTRYFETSLGYTKGVSIQILTNEPIEHWPKLAKRLQGKKEKERQVSITDIHDMAGRFFDDCMSTVDRMQCQYIDPMSALFEISGLYANYKFEYFSKDLKGRKELKSAFLMVLEDVYDRVDTGDKGYSTWLAAYDRMVTYIHKKKV